MITILNHIRNTDCQVTEDVRISSRGVPFGRLGLSSSGRCSLGFACLWLSAGSAPAASPCDPARIQLIHEPSFAIQGLSAIRMVAKGSLLLANANNLSDGSRPGGVVHLYEPSGGAYSLTHTFFDSTPAPNRRTWACATNGTTVLLGSVVTNASGITVVASGDVDVFQRVDGSWVNTQRLVAPDIFPADLYGRSVGIGADIAVVGAPGMPSGGSGASTARIFRREGDSWVYEARIFPTSPPPSAFINFGGPIVVDGERIFVGAISESIAGMRKGAVYVFERVNGVWSQVARIPNPLTEGGSFFGNSIAPEGDRVLIGASASDPDGRGKAFIFERQAGQWTPTATLEPTGAPVGSRDFGQSVGLQGDQAIVGMPGFGQSPVTFDSSEGAVFVLRRTPNGWVQSALLEHQSAASPPTGGCRMGTQAIILDGRAIIGIPFDGPPDRSGSIAVYDLNPPLAGDADSNKLVDMKDLTAALTDFGANYAPGTGPGDADHNGVVNFADITASLANWGVTCP